jgi:hypothetical protein
MEHRPARVIGVFGDGSLLARAVLWGEPIPDGAVEWRDMGLFRHLGDGTQPRLLLNLRDSENTSGEGMLVFPARAALGVHDDGFYYSDGRATEILAYDATGQLRQRARWPGEIIPVSQAAKDEYFATSRANIEAFGGDPNAEAHLEKVIFTDDIPVIARILVDDIGNVWAMRHTGIAFPITYPNSPGRSDPPPAGRWEVFSPDGAWYGTFEFPAGIYPAQIGADFLLTAFQDDAGVQRILKYELIKP